MTAWLGHTMPPDFTWTVVLPIEVSGMVIVPPEPNRSVSVVVAPLKVCVAVTWLPPDTGATLMILSTVVPVLSPVVVSLYVQVLPTAIGYKLVPVNELPPAGAAALDEAFAAGEAGEVTGVEAAPDPQPATPATASSAAPARAAREVKPQRFMSSTFR